MSRTPVLYTSMSLIRSYGPCEPGWQKLLRYTKRKPGDTSPLPFSVILRSNGLDDSLWALARSGPLQEIADIVLREFACAAAYRVLPIYERAYPGDDRPRKAIEAGWDYARGKISIEQLRMAQAAARAAARAAALAAWAVALAARAARDAAQAAAQAAARAAAWAARDAAWAAQYTAQYAALAAEAAGAAEKRAQHRILRTILRNVEAL